MKPHTETQKLITSVKSHVLSPSTPGINMFHHLSGRNAHVGFILCNLFLYHLQNIRE